MAFLDYLNKGLNYIDEHNRRLMKPQEDFLRERFGDSKDKEKAVQVMKKKAIMEAQRNADINPNATVVGLDNTTTMPDPHPLPPPSSPNLAQQGIPATQPASAPGAPPLTTPTAVTPTEVGKTYSQEKGKEEAPSRADALANLGLGRLSKAKESFDIGREFEARGLTQQAQTEMRKADIEASAFKRMGETLEERQRKAEKDLQWMRDTIAEGLQKQQVISDRIIAAQPLTHSEARHRVWSNMNVPQKIFAGIAVLLGGKEAFDFDQLVENEIADQRAQIQNLREDRAEAANLLDLNLKRYGDLQTAETATQLMTVDIIKNEMDQQLAQARNPEAKAKLQIAFGALADKKGALEMKLGEHLFDQAEDEYKREKGLAQKDKELKPMSPEAAGKFSFALTALPYVRDLFEEFDNADYQRILNANIGHSKLEVARGLFEETILRILTGAAIKDSERKDIQYLIPRQEDSVGQAHNKIEAIKKILSGYVISVDPTGGHRRNINIAGEGSLTEVIKGTRHDRSLNTLPKESL